MDAGRFISAKKGQKQISKKVFYLSEEEAKGRVKKTIFFSADPKEKGDLIEIALMELEPGAEILLHQHITGTEYCVSHEMDFSSVCKCGQSHGYRNPSEKTIPLLSVKFAEIV